jgi:hypothetical protein
LKHLGITSETVHTFLDAGATTVVEADDRNSRFHGSIHNFADFFGVHLAEGAAEHGEILRKHKNGTAIDGPFPSHNCIAKEMLLVHAKVVATVIHELKRYFTVRQQDK